MRTGLSGQNPIDDLGLTGIRNPFTKAAVPGCEPNVQKGGEPTIDQDTYYRAAPAALELLIERDGRITVEALGLRPKQWRRAYLSTPHGNPVEL